MKSKEINLHMNPKRALCFVAFFSLIALLINVVIAEGTDLFISQISSIVKSGYDYSVTANSAIGKDDYLRYDAGISFALSAESATSINADIIMQVAGSSYSDIVRWNVHELKSHEIAITNSLARYYRLKLGDKLYSKHIVYDELIEYTIAEILPEATSVRSNKVNNNYNNGIIIMGNDESYTGNLSHKYIAFTNLKIDELKKFMPENIVYRDDELYFSVRQIAPYIVVLIIAMIILIWGQCLWLTKGLKYNFIRLATLGYDEKLINKTYSRFITRIGVISIMAVGVASFIICRVLRLCMESIWLVGISILVGIVVLFVTTNVLNRQLWRK